MTSPLPLKALHAFDAVMRLGGVGRAAERLSVTHGAVSRQIGRLQRALGVVLFEGPRNARRPTAEADRLWRETAPAFTALDAAVASRAGGRRPLRVSCLSTLAARWLIPRLPGFAAEAPDIAVELTESYAALERDLGGADLAVRMLAAGAVPPEGLVATPFMDNTVGMVIAASATGTPDRRLASRSHPEAWANWARESGRPVPAAPQIDFDHQQTMIEAAVAGLGAAVTQRALVEADLAAGRLAAPFGFVADGARFAVFSRPADTSAAARRFIAWLDQQGRPTAA